MEKWINQTLTTGLVVMFRSSLNKEQNITTKPVVSVWFIHFYTYFYHRLRFAKIYHFSTYIYICVRINLVLNNPQGFICHKTPTNIKGKYCPIIGYMSSVVFWMSHLVDNEVRNKRKPHDNTYTHAHAHTHISIYIYTYD